MRQVHFSGSYDSQKDWYEFLFVQWHYGFDRTHYAFYMFFYGKIVMTLQSTERAYFLVVFVVPPCRVQICDTENEQDAKMLTLPYVETSTT